MNGRQVFRWATSKMPEVSLSVLHRNGVTPADLDLVVPHQANKTMIIDIAGTSTSSRS